MNGHPLDMMPLLPGTNELRAAALLALQPLFRSDDGPLSTEARPSDCHSDHR